MKAMGRPVSSTSPPRPLRLGLMMMVVVLFALSQASTARAHNATACNSCSGGPGQSWCAPPSVVIQADVCVAGQGTAGQNGAAFQSYQLAAGSGSGQWYLSFFASASCSDSVVSFGPCGLQACCMVDFQLEGQAAYTQLVVDEAPAEPSREPKPPTSGASREQAPTWFILMIAGLVCLVLMAGCIGWMVHLAKRLKRINYQILSAQAQARTSNDELRVLPLA